MIKTFRGLLTDSSPGNQNRIRLQTIKGKVGYRIVKFELFPKAPGTSDYENVVQLFKKEQSTITGTVDFTDNDVLAAGYMEGYSGNADTDGFYTIFDQEIFNQDIYITNKDLATGESINYYIELEVIPLDDAGAEYTTLKDMRST